MQIQELRVQGFRSLRDIAWRPGRLNVLIGPNGSGKSNLLRALELLQRATQGRLAEEILQQGGIAPLLWDSRVTNITWNLATCYDGNEERAFMYHLDLRRLGTTSSYRVEAENLIEGDTSLLERHVNEASVALDSLTRATISSSFPEDQSLLSRVEGLKLLNTPPYSDLLGFYHLLEHWAVYHDIKVDQQAILRQAAVARLDKQISPDGQNLIPVLHTLYSGNREFKGTVDRSMRAAFGPEYEELVFPPAADQRVQLRIRWRSLKTEQSAANLSDGTLRFLLLLAILANPEPGSLIAIDEPETGLHPSMFPIIAELAAEAAERTQVILTTHSPQFLDAFTGEPPTTTVAQWDQGETRLSVVDGEELRRWLQEYSLGALFRSGELEALA